MRSASFFGSREPVRTTVPGSLVGELVHNGHELMFSNEWVFEETEKVPYLVKDEVMAVFPESELTPLGTPHPSVRVDVYFIR